MAINKEIKRDNFKLFDLTIHQNHSDATLTLRKEIHRFNFSFCNLFAVIFQSLLDNHYYIAVCTESEYYIDNIYNYSQNIIRRYVVLPIPQEFVVQDKLNTFLSEEYLQLFLDDYLMSKTFPYNEAFIFDECIGDSYISRIFYPDLETFKFYLHYVFDTERYFLNINNDEYLFLHNKQYRNHYIEVKDANLETSISEHLKTSLLINLKIGDIFPFQENAKKISKNFLKSQFSSYFEHNNELIFSSQKLNLGFFETQSSQFFLYIKTECHHTQAFAVDRYILIPTTKEQAFIYSRSEFDLFSKFVLQHIEQNEDLLIFENNISHPHFNFLYEISVATKKQYFHFLLLNEDDKHSYCLRNNNEINFIEMPELPYSHKFETITDSQLFDNFNLPLVKFNQKSIVHTILQKENTFIHKVTGAKYYFNTLLFSNQKEQMELNNVHSYFSRVSGENVLLHQDQVIGFIQQHKLFSLSNEDYILFLHNRHLKNSKNYMIEDMIDEYECKFNIVRYSLFYLEFINEKNIIHKIALLAPNEEQNILKEAQNVLFSFMKNNNSSTN